MWEAWQAQQRVVAGAGWPLGAAPVLALVPFYADGQGHAAHGMGPG